MTPEQRSRQRIDHLLRECGWAVQDCAEMDISAGPGVAVREFPLKTGAADYLLYADGRVVGVVEVKPEGHNPGLRSALVDVLIQWGPGAKDAAPVLAGLTAAPPGDDDDPLCYAASALSAVDPDDPRLVPALVQALGYNSLTRATALDDLAAIGPRARPAVPAIKRVADGMLPLKHPPKPQGPPGTPAGLLQGGSEEGSLKKSQMRAAELVRSLSG